MPPEDEKEAPPRPVKKSRGYLIPFIVLVLIVGVVLLGQATKGTQKGPKFSYGDVEILARKKHKVYRMTKAVMTEKGENSELKFWVVPKEAEEGEGEEEGAFAATVTVGDRHEDIDRLLRETLGTKYDKEGPSPFLPFLFSIAPWIILIVLFWFFIIRQMRAPGGANVLSFGRSRARLRTVRVAPPGRIGAGCSWKRAGAAEYTTAARRRKGVPRAPAGEAWRPLPLLISSLHRSVLQQHYSRMTSLPRHPGAAP